MKKLSWKLIGIIVVLIIAAYCVVSIGYSRFKVTDAENKRAQVLIEKELKELEVEKKNNEALLKQRKKEEEIEKKKAAEEALLIKQREEMEKQTYYVGLKGAVLLDENQIAIGNLAPKKKVFAAAFIKNTQGIVEKIQVKENYDDVLSLGYVHIADVVKSKIDWIEAPVYDADYTPFEKQEVPANKATNKEPVRGVFVTGNTARGARIDEIIQLIEETDLNAVVIDVKDDNGYLLFKSDTASKYNPKANDHIYVKDIEALMEKLKAHNIYTIARIVTFKSPLYAKEHPDRAIVYKDTEKLYSDADGLIWASPYDRELWQFNVGVAKEAINYGFDEVQFDYVRFPAIAQKDKMNYRNKTDESNTAAIQNFLKFAYQELSAEGVYISADVFGWIATAKDDVGIGQHWEALSNVVDYMCPMMYPSHYGPNNFGLPVPDAQPYETINRSIKDALSRNENIETPSKLRPWIQDFTATWVKGHIRYGANEVKAQIDALKENGVDEYLVWNAGNYYSKEAFK